MAGSEQRKTDEMQSVSRHHSGRSSRFALFLLFARLPKNRMTRSRLGMEAFSSPWRFSARLRWSCWGAQLRQKGRHDSANLRQGQDRSARLPRSIDPGDQRTSQNQLVVSTGNDLRSAFRLLWGAQTWHIPQQHLFVQSVAMLLRVAQAVGRANLGQGSRFVPFPDKPTDLGIAPTFTRPRAGSPGSR